MTRKLQLAALAWALLLPAAALSQDAPGVFKIPGTDSTLRLYGYAELDGTWDLSGRIGDIENYDWASIVPVQPLDGTPQANATGQTYLTARTSRFGIQTKSPTPIGPLEVKIEGDFNGPNGFQGQTFTNSVLFRLRQAYGNVHGFLVGQTWTNFIDFPSMADTVDFNGPGSIALIRQPQIRYTADLNPAMALSFALENSHNGGVGTLPDITAKFSFTPKWGSVGLGFETNQYHYPSGTIGTSGYNPIGSSKQGYGLLVAGSYKLLQKDTLVGYMAFGEGIGRYIFNDLAGQFTGTGPTGDFLLWRELAYHVGYTHVWNDQLRSNLIWSQTFFDRNGIDTATFATADDPGAGTFVPNKRIDQAFVNTFYGLTKTFWLGAEYAYGRRTTWFNNLGRENRINLAAHYDFY